MIPVCCHAEPNITAKNWDGTLIPKPFARITVSFGEPIYVPAGADREKCEEMREIVDRRMAEEEAKCRA